MKYCKLQQPTKKPKLTPEIAREIARTDRTFFHQWYIDPRKPPTHQVKLFRFLDDHEEGLILMPRGHLKSSSVAFSYPLQELMKDNNKKILLIQESSRLACLTLEQIAKQLRNNKKIQKNYTYYIERDTQEMLFLKSEGIEKEPSILAAGVMGAITGFHPDIIILDDPVSLEMVKTPYRMQEIRTWFWGTIYHMKKKGTKIFVIGTRKHFGDLYADLMKKFPVYHEKAIIQHPTSYEVERDKEGIPVRVSSVKGQPKTLWPSEWPIERLLLMKEKSGTVHFNREMQNEPLSDEDAPFKLHWLNYYEEIKGKIKGRFAAVDPAISLKKGSDYFALVSILLMENNDLYIEKYIHDKFSFPEQVKTIKNFIRQHQYTHDNPIPFKIVIEANAYQESLVQQLAREETLPVIPIKNVTKSKEERIISTTPYFEAGRVYIRENMADFIEQYVQFPKGAHDDLFDAIEMAIRTAVNTPTKGWVMSG